MKEISGEAISIALTVEDPREDGKPDTFLNHASLQAIKVASKEFEYLDDLRQLESRTTNAPASRTHHDEHLVTLLRHQYKATLQSLTDDQKQAFVLYYLKDQKVSDIAKQMGRGEKAIRSMLERGRKSARKIDAQSHLTAPNAD